jgi:hypothetical protein
MVKIKVVYDKRTKKMYEFTTNDLGEVEIISQYPYEMDNLIVSMVDVNLIDFENGYVMIRGDHSGKETS